MDERLEEAQKLDCTVNEEAQTIEVQAENFSVYAVSYLGNRTKASHMASRPEDGVTAGHPFPKGTGGSTSFRIPAMITLADGTIVAAADARWNTTYDGGGLDTIVSRCRQMAGFPGIIRLRIILEITEILTMEPDQLPLLIRHLPQTETKSICCATCIHTVWH